MPFKTCTKCSISKSETEFNFRNRAADKKHSYCRECGKLYKRKHYKNNKKQYLKRNNKSFSKRRELVRQLKSHPCMDCGVQYPFYVMDFDHREDETKFYTLNRIERIGMNKLKQEIAKCDVVCSNCHRERTHQRMNRKKLLDS